MMTVKTLSADEKVIYEAAVETLRQGTTVAVFTEQFFGPEGMLGRLATNRDEREALVQTQLYQWLKEQVAELRRTEAKAFDREIAGLSGRLTVVVAKSLHGALRREAVKEGVSLSELIRLKLSLPYSETVALLSAGARRKTTPHAAPIAPVRQRAHAPHRAR
jgi:predicted HicB family RNase H-like nuclease